METTALLTMILLLSLVWGGFALSLSLAIRKEKLKKNIVE